MSAAKNFHNDIDTMSHAQLAKYVERLQDAWLTAHTWFRPRHRYHDAIAEQLNYAQIALSRLEDEETNQETWTRLTHG